MQAYRFITTDDDNAEFCHRVSHEAESNSWKDYMKNLK